MVAAGKPSRLLAFMYILNQTNVVRMGGSKEPNQPRKTRLDFNAAFAFDWDTSLVTDRTRPGDGESRFAALGMLAGKIHTVVFTKRVHAVRIISLRRSNRTEERVYASVTKESR